MNQGTAQTADREARLGDILAAWLEAVEAGQTPDRAAWLARYPEFAAELTEFFADHDQLHAVAAPLRDVAQAAATPVGAIHHPRLAPESGSFGDYELLEVLGQGGMGIVYKAWQKSLNRTVALKMIRADRLASPEQVRRIRNEAEAVAALDHPGVVPIYEVGECAGQPFFTMKLLEGGSLAGGVGNETKDVAGASAPATPSRSIPTTESRTAARLLAQVALAVHHAHQRGILHRDLKPSNILLDAEGRPHVADFGLAKWLTGDSSLTGTGAVVGTPSYAAPEQAAANPRQITTAADIYGLGAILYALLTGRPPFQGDTPLDTLDRVRQEEPVAPRRLNRAIPADLETIVAKAMDKNPEARYGTAKEMVDDLERFLRDEPIRARRPSLMRRLGQWCRRHKTVTWSVIATAVVGAGSIGFVLWDKAGRLTAIEQQVTEAIAGARTAIEAGDLKLARQRVALAEGCLGTERASLPARAADCDRVLKEIETRQADEARYRQFLKLASEGPDNMFFGDRDGQSLVSEALDLYGVLKTDDWLGRLDNSYLTARQKEQIRETAYVTLVTLADWCVRWNWDNPDSQRFERCPVLLARAQAFHEPTRAFFFVRSVYHQYRKNTIEADKDVKRFQEAPARTAWDYFLPGHSAAWGGNLKEAIRSYRAALALEPNHYNSLFFLAMRFQSDEIKRVPEAIQLYTACIALRQDNVFAYVSRAEGYSQLGQLEDAEADLTTAIAWEQKTGHKSHEWYMMRSKIYKDLGRTEKAREDLREALAWLRTALAARQKKLEMEPNQASQIAQKLLAWQKHESLKDVRGDEALAKLPEAERQQWQALWMDVEKTRKRAGGEKEALLEAKLQKFLSGEAKPDDPAELVALADFCREPYKQLYASSARLYRAAFAAGVNAVSETGYNFARAAALAGCGQGDEGAALEAGERASLRGEALAHLQGSLASYWRAIVNDPETIRGYIRWWQQDSAFAGVRGEEALAKLPEAERQEWRKLWQEVEELGRPLADLKRILPAARFDAVAVYRKAIERSPKNASLYKALGTTLYQQQKLGQAEHAFREAIRLNPRLADAHYNLGRVLYLQDKFPEAEEVSRTAVKLQPRNANAYNTLENILRARQKVAEADAAQQMAIKLDNVAAEVNLGSLLLRQGKNSEGLDAYKRAHKLKTLNNPSHPARPDLYIQWTEQGVQFHAKLLQVLKDEAQPADPAEGVRLAELCQLRWRQLYAASAQLYNKAFAADPTLVDEPRTGVRYGAAAQAGCGRGKDAGDLDAKEYARLRGQGRAWLRSDLAAWRSELEEEPTAARNGVRYEMRQWREDPALGCVRGEEALAKLPEAERQQWRALWQEVEELARNAGESK